MKSTLKLSLMAALAVTVVACATSSAPVGTLRSQAVDQIDSAPDVKTYAGKRPGQATALIARTFDKQPPLIPHAIEGMDIGPKSNDCWDCHNSNEFKGKKMPMVSLTHLLKQPAQGEDPELNLKRWQCNNCHVPQVDAPPLVENSFKG